MVYPIAISNLLLVITISSWTVAQSSRSTKHLKAPSATAVPRKECPLNSSQVVLDALETEFFPLVLKHNTTLTDRCLLLRERNIYWQFGGNLAQTAENQGWQCQTCGKYFYTKVFAKKHILRKHPELVDKNPDSICLGDLCDVFRCQLRVAYPHVPPLLSCDEKEVLSTRRKCESIIRDCLPATAHQAYDEIWRSMCSTLTCEKYMQPFEDSVSIGTVVILCLFLPVLLFVAVCTICQVWDHFNNTNEEEYQYGPDDKPHRYEEDRRNQLAKVKGLNLRKRTAYR